LLEPSRAQGRARPSVLRTSYFVSSLKLQR